MTEPLVETQPLEPHPKTGLPVQPVPTYSVGDLVSEHINSDAYPAVVVAVTPKTVWVSKVAFVGAFAPGDTPGYNGYGDSGTIVVDPESVQQALAAGPEKASKYVLRVAPKPVSPRSMSMRDEQAYGSEGYHRAGWRKPGASGMYLSTGASYRQDPHL